MLYRNIHKDLLEKILRKASEMELKTIIKGEWLWKLKQ